MCRLVMGFALALAAVTVGGLYWFALTEPMTPAERCGSQYDSPP
jgi:hypothetical protein